MAFDSPGPFSSVVRLYWFPVLDDCIGAMVRGVSINGVRIPDFIASSFKGYLTGRPWQEVPSNGSYKGVQYQKRPRLIRLSGNQRDQSNILYILYIYECPLPLPIIHIKPTLLHRSEGAYACMHALPTSMAEQTILKQAQKGQPG